MRETRTWVDPGLLIDVILTLDGPFMLRNLKVFVLAQIFLSKSLSFEGNEPVTRIKIRLTLVGN